MEREENEPAHLTSSDEILMAAVAQGDMTSFRLLMERWEGAAKRYAYRATGDYQASEDLAQETFVRLFRSADQYRPTARFSTYFYTVLGNLCRDRHRAAKRRGGWAVVPQEGWRSEDEVEATGVPGPVHLAEEHERRLIVRKAVSELPTNLMEALSLREFEGLSYQEIADVMDANLGEVKTWIHRGRKKLAERLRVMLAEDEQA